MHAMNRFSLPAALALLLLASCADRGDEAGATPAEPAAERAGDAAPYWDRVRLSREELDSGRQDPSWQQVVQIDPEADTDSAAAGPLEAWDEISPQSLNSSPMRLPLHGEVEGPSVLRTQILLDRALFSPGIMDGRWGKNTEKAIYWLQRREGLPATGRLNRATFERLVQLAGESPPVRAHTLTAEDVEGPFVTIPEDIYEQAELDCMCYESLTEKLGEMFHATPEVLAQLNPGVALDELTAGETVQVPAIRDAASPPSVRIARLVVSDRGHYVHAMDEGGRILMHFPSTLGSRYDPSPTGNLRVTSITEDPWWHYQPSILEHVDDSEPEARIPPGPNSAVGRVWMALSEPHYGIHGTSAPETIGYATSAGCVRLTNWDAIYLSRLLQDDTPVDFQDT